MPERPVGLERKTVTRIAQITRIEICVICAIRGLITIPHRQQGVPFHELDRTRHPTPRRTATSPLLPGVVDLLRPFPFEEIRGATRVAHHWKRKDGRPRAELGSDRELLLFG